MEKEFYLPAEWQKQSFIQLTWPHEETDWAYMLDEVEKCFLQLAREIASRQQLVVVAPQFPDALKDFELLPISLYVEIDPLTTRGLATMRSSPYSRKMRLRCYSTSALTDGV